MLLQGWQKLCLVVWLVRLLMLFLVVCCWLVSLGASQKLWCLLCCLLAPVMHRSWQMLCRSLQVGYRCRWQGLQMPWWHHSWCWQLPVPAACCS